MVDEPLGQAGWQHELPAGDDDEAVAQRTEPEPCPPGSPMRALKCWMDFRWADAPVSDGNTQPSASSAKRIDALFEFEREINGMSFGERSY